MTSVMRLCALIVAVAAISVHADSLDDFYARFLKERNIPSAAIAVVKNGKVVRVGAYGTADLERGIAPQPSTVYKIGSVSKQFIAAGIMLLVQDRRVSLDDPVRRHIPAAPAAWQPITLRHLLTHTSGLMRESPGFEANRVQPDLNVMDAMRRLRTGPRFGRAARSSRRSSTWRSGRRHCRRIASSPPRARRRCGRG